MLPRLMFLLALVLAPLIRAAPPQVVLMIGEDEYKTWETLPAFAATELKSAGYRVTIVQANPNDKNDFPELIAALRDADLLLVSVRRRTPVKEQLDAVRAHLARGKALVGIRTACHAFSPLPGAKVSDPRLDAWTTFDPEVLGGHYTGHHRGERRTTITLAPGAAQSPILRGVGVAELATSTVLYKVSPLASTTTPVLFGTFGDEPAEPVAWTHLYGAKRARVFFTSLGGPDDFAHPAFRHLLANGIQWALGQ